MPSPPGGGAMAVPDEFPEITRPNEPLAPYTHLKIGGPAEFFVQPRAPEELAAVLRHCAGRAIPTRVLGGGVNLLVRDEAVPGVVLRLSAPAFTAITVKSRQVRAGCGAALPALISAPPPHGLTRFATPVGIPATLGG